MFTGIIEAVGKVRSITDHEMWLDTPFARELKLGQSVACDGVCLTVVEMDGEGFRVEFLEETKRLTSFDAFESGFFVNVERAMKADDRFDGHIVQAHSEGIAMIKKIEHVEHDRLITCQFPSHLNKYIVHKGIIILNGIALTVTDVDDEQSELQVAIIPHTWENTNLQYLQEGAKMNIETDVLGKYVEKLLAYR